MGLAAGVLFENLAISRRVGPRETGRHPPEQDVVHAQRWICRRWLQAKRASYLYVTRLGISDFQEFKTVVHNILPAAGSSRLSSTTPRQRSTGPNKNGRSCRAQGDVHRGHRQLAFRGILLGTPMSFHRLVRVRRRLRITEHQAVPELKLIGAVGRNVTRTTGVS